MKKTFALVAVIAFIGVSAFSLNYSENSDPKSAEKKSDCTVVADKSDCGSATNAVLTDGAEAAKEGSECGSASAVVKTAKKSSDCASETTTKTAAVKASGCCPSGAAATKTASADECGSEKSKPASARIAENK